MDDGGPRARDVAVALTTGTLTLLAGALVGVAAVLVAGDLLPRPTAAEAARYDLWPVFRTVLLQTLVGAAALALGAFASGLVTARRLLHAGAEPGGRLAFLALLPALVTGLLVVAVRVGGGATDELRLWLVLTLVAMAGARVGAWWARRRWRRRARAAAPGA